MKTNLDSLFKTNEDAEKDGVWFEISDDTAFLVKRFGGKNGQSIKEAHAKYMRPHARKIEAGTMGQKKEQSILIKFFVNACLLDWKGIEIDGEKVDYSPEAAIKLFTGLPDLLAQLMDDANNMEHYKELEKEDLGNS